VHRLPVQVFELLDHWTNSLEASDYLQLCNRILAFVTPRFHGHGPLDSGLDTDVVTSHEATDPSTPLVARESGLTDQPESTRYRV
jgi:hypothetical protein